MHWIEIPDSFFLQTELPLIRRGLTIGNRGKEVGGLQCPVLPDAFFHILVFPKVPSSGLTDEIIQEAFLVWPLTRCSRTLKTVMDVMLFYNVCFFHKLTEGRNALSLFDFSIIKVRPLILKKITKSLHKSHSVYGKEQFGQLTLLNLSWSLQCIKFYSNVKGRLPEQFYNQNTSSIWASVPIYTEISQKGANQLIWNYLSPSQDKIWQMVLPLTSLGLIWFCLSFR